MACQKKKYSPTWLSEYSLDALKRLEETKLFQQAECIALYHALPGEVETADFIEKWADTKTLLLPVVEGEDLFLLPYKGKNNLQCGVYGIMEPERCDPWPEDRIDLLIIPGIAFDRLGNRLGRGKGYYDRLLTTFSSPKIGLCFDFQLVDQVPTEPFDICMDGVVTNKEVVWIV